MRQECGSKMDGAAAQWALVFSGIHLSPAWFLGQKLACRVGGKSQLQGFTLRQFQLKNHKPLTLGRLGEDCQSSKTALPIR